MLVKPYCDPDGLVGVIESVECLPQFGKTEDDLDNWVYIVKYLATRDSFNRTHIHVSIYDPNGIVTKISNPGTYKVLFESK